ncbi:MAG: A/G-specific adenine glycosylase [Paludibacteraceae bacterium]|nr:A/G-specific adenine glycosylase [Paludibacteraceae bacterium]
MKLLHNELIDWYELNKRILPWRETDDPYKIWISEIILQQTRVAQGMEYYMRFVERFPNIQSLADAEEDEVLLYWQGLGYYSRARNLHKAAKIAASSGLFNMVQNSSTLYEQLRSLPGIGDYTAGAIASFAFDLPYPALDGNVYRVLSRLYDCEIAFDTTQGKKHFRKLAEELLDRERPRLFNSAIMELGALHCVPTAPDCHTCPLNTWCKALANNTVELLPVRKPRPKLRERYLEYTIYITPERTTLIHQRKGNDIWKHLYEFPVQEIHSLEDAHSGYSLSAPHNAASVIGAPAEVKGEKILELTHVLSHQKLHARFIIKNVPELPKIPDTVVVHLSDLDNYAFSRLTLRAIEFLAQR